jgi:hypothetical protein
MISISSLRHERPEAGGLVVFAVDSDGVEGPPGAAVPIIGGRLKFCGAPEGSFFSDMASSPPTILGTNESSTFCNMTTPRRNTKKGRIDRRLQNGAGR